MLLVVPPQITYPDAAAYTQLLDIRSPLTLALAQTPKEEEVETVPVVPFYSQFKDITSAKWQKVGCGITSLAMIIEYYDPQDVSVNKLLNEGIAAGAYLNNAGWTYAGLINVSKKYGMAGSSHDLGKSSMKSAYAELKKNLEHGPLIVSVHYKMDPKSTIPHLVVVTGIDGDTVYYNDPAAKAGGGTISSADFQKAWKKRFIVVRPTIAAKAEANT